MSKEINRNYKIDFVNNTITISKAFEQRANVFGSKENKVMRELMKAFPAMEMVHKKVKAPNKAKVMTMEKIKPKYDAMEHYIECLTNANGCLARFNAIREMAKSQRSPYTYTKEWFIATFPDFLKRPAFDGEGKIIAKVDLEAGQKRIDELEHQDAA